MRISRASMAAGTLLFASVAPLLSIAQEEVGDSVRGDLRDYLRARVIVVMNPPQVSDAFSMAYSQPQQYLTSALTGDQASNVRQISDLPLAVAEVTADAVEMLRSDPAVALVVKDELRAPSLLTQYP